MSQDTSYFRRSIIRQIMGFILFVFGMNVLISLETWIKIFLNIYGNSIVTTIHVLIIFLFGLGIGAYYFGRKTDKRKDEIRQFLVHNLILGIYIFFLLLVFPSITPVIKAFFLKTGGNLAFLNILKFFITLLLLFLPSALIGGTLPIIVKFFIQSPGRSSYELGNITSILFLGASIGSFLAGLILFQTIGVKQTLATSAFFYLLCASVLKILLNNVEPIILLENEFFEKQLKLFSHETKKEPRIFRKLILVAIVFLGFWFSSNIILWIRCGYFLQKPQIYSSKMLLIVIFIGISIGSLIYSRTFSKHKNLYPALALIPIILSAYSILLITAFPLFSVINHYLGSLLQFGEHGTLLLLTYFLNAVLIALVPGILVGCAFILANRILLINLQKRCQIIGSSIALFSLGNFLGLIVTGLFLLSAIGIQKSIIFISLTNFFSGLVLMFVYSIQSMKIKKPSLVFAGVVFVLIISFIIIPSNFIQKTYRGKQKDENLLYAKEGVHTTVSIHKELRTNYLSLASNGVLIGETPENNLSVKLILSHLPMLLHPHPDSILVVGYGDGKIVRKILLHQVKQLDCVEKSPTVVKTSFIFNNNKKFLSNNPNLHIVYMNESNYVKLTNQKYNVIVDNCFFPAYSGNSNLFSKEYFLSCKKILTSPGIMAIAVPLCGMSIEDFKIVIRTFFEVFPLTSAWYNNNSLNRHVLLVGKKNLSNEINVNQIHFSINRDSIKVDLSYSGLDNIYEMLDCFIMGHEELNKLTLGVRINSENRPILEFATFKALDDPAIFNNILQLLKSYREPVFPYITNIDTLIEKMHVFRRILDNYFKSSNKVLDALSSQLLGDEKQALNFYQKAYMINRLDKAAKTFLSNYYDPYLFASPKTPFELTENANICFQKTEFEKAISLLEEAINIDKNYSPAYFALGLNYEIVGDFVTAKEMYLKTLRLKPNLQNVKKRLKAVTALLDKETF